MTESINTIEHTRKIHYVCVGGVRGGVCCLQLKKEQIRPPWPCLDADNIENDTTYNCSLQCLGLGILYPFFIRCRSACPFIPGYGLAPDVKHLKNNLVLGR